MNDKSAVEETARVFSLQKYDTISVHAYSPVNRSLHRAFYQMRVDRLKNAELSKRSREILKVHGSLPSVPRNLP